MSHLLTNIWLATRLLLLLLLLLIIVERLSVATAPTAACDCPALAEGLSFAFLLRMAPTAGNSSSSGENETLLAFRVPSQLRSGVRNCAPLVLALTMGLTCDLQRMTRLTRRLKRRLTIRFATHNMDAKDLFDVLFESCATVAGLLPRFLKGCEICCS